MKLAWLMALVVGVFLSIGSAMAVAPGKTVEFAPKGADKVVFDGKVHADKGAKCNDCHKDPALFPMKTEAKGAPKLTMAAINAGKECGACHDGKKAFKSSDPANCAKCHKK
jgi:c(7)-type cytochrome triheme protein